MRELEAFDGQELYDLADALEANEANRFADPHDIIGTPRFEEGVDILSDPEVPLEQVVSYSLGTNWVLGIMASEALARREDSGEVVDRILANIGQAAQWPLFFRLRFLAARAEDPVIGPVLTRIQESWAGAPVTVAAIDEFIDERAASGEEPTFGDELDDLSPSRCREIETVVRRLSGPHAASLLEELTRHREATLDPEFVATTGRLWTEEIPGSAVFRSASIEDRLTEMRRAFQEVPPRSILLVGERGVGKTVLRRLFSGEITAEGWRVFETSGTELLAGTRYIGDIETRVARLRKNISVEKRVALWVDRLGELATAGKSSNHPVSVLDHLWPHLKAQELFLVSEVTPESYQVLERRYPGLAAVMKVVRISPASEAESAELARSLMSESLPDVDESVRTDVVSDALGLARSYLAHEALPGSALSLMELAISRARAQSEPLGRSHLLGGLSELTGLPLEILDDRQQLDVEALRDDFRSRVIGQDEAVDCLVERIAMLKAGLTDPERPVGVFLFAGPTGTGKTEIAKTLARILFGSAEQMIRLDMSEFQTPESLPRLLGTTDDGHATRSSRSLVERIRRHPFSVVLLDEFEKAHRNVWDIFLQVFDDGRLTNRQGELADFRHAIIILTSNLGATISNEGGIGFVGKAGQFSSREVERVVNRTFRKEFINRLDEVVVFRPLSREVMRLILRKELDDALSRRGFQSKAWAVEWEDSAIELLLEKGFTPDLGARPLRRAIERHLLAPLSVTIVENRAPEGEQFLFVRGDGDRLDVEFVDPDAEPEDAELAEAALAASAEEPSIRSVMSGASGTEAEGAFLLARVAAVVDRVRGEGWREAKAEGLAEMGRDGFWDRDDRFDVLGTVELMDRIESATDTLEALADRMERSPGSASLHLKVAEKLYVLEEGLRDLDEERPGMAFLGVRLLREDADHPEARAFLERIVGMYRGWAGRRRMQLTRLTPDRVRPVDGPVFSVSGFGAHAILAREAGLHVFEVPKDESRFDRIRVRVSVAAQEVAPNLPEDQLLAEARSALTDPEGQTATVVRRYREEPSPLVRDGVRGWRTGRTETVWAGDFDICQ